MKTAGAREGILHAFSVTTHARKEFCPLFVSPLAFSFVYAAHVFLLVVVGVQKVNTAAIFFLLVRTCILSLYWCVVCVCVCVFFSFFKVVSSSFGFLASCLLGTIMVEKLQ